MSGWLWVVVGLVAWCGLAVVVAVALGAGVRIADRRERHGRPRSDERAEVSGDERDWPAAG